jgi:hypothetical protein
MRFSLSARGVWVLALVWCGCEADPGKAALARAKAQYEALSERGRPVNDPAFDEVAKLLRQVAPPSAAYPEAQKLLSSLDTARRPLAPRVWGQPDGGARPPEPGEEQHHPP